MNNSFGFIETIDETKFKCNGSIYIVSNLTEEDKTVDLNEQILKMKFDNKVFEIMSGANDARIDKDLNARNKDVEDFLSSKENNILDIIFFPDNGFRGTSHISIEENSIVYIKISENIKLGFFINKIIAKSIFGGFKNAID